MPENLVSRDSFGSSVPSQRAHLHTQADESGAYLWDSSRVPRRRLYIYLNRHTPSGQSRIYRVTKLRTDGVHHNIVTAHVKLLGRFARNRPVREAKGPPSIDGRRLMTDPHLRQQVATAIGDHLRAFPPSSSSVDDVETTFTTAILQTAERVAPRERPGCRGGDGGETPRQKQRSAWRWPRDEQPGSGRGLIPRTSS